MRQIWAAAAGAAALWVSGAAQGQLLPDPEAVVVEELVVQAREPGPAWWRVSDGDTTVYILAVGDDRLPADLAWDRRWLERRMKGANALILGTHISLAGGVRDIPALLKARSRLKSKAPLEETLDPDLRARFVAARQRLGKPASRYAEWTPLMAGQRLVEDGEPKGVSVSAAVVKLAKREKVKVVEPAPYEAVPFIRRALDSLTPAIHRQCLEGALADVEAPPDRSRRAAEGWTQGDVAAALAEPRSFEKCILLLGGGVELWRRARDDRAAAIAKALETPGHAVALMPLRQLLAEDGILETLQAQGFKVAAPGEA